MLLTSLSLNKASGEKNQSKRMEIKREHTIWKAVLGFLNSFGKVPVTSNYCPTALRLLPNADALDGKNVYDFGRLQRQTSKNTTQTSDKERVGQVNG